MCTRTWKGRSPSPERTGSTRPPRPATRRGGALSWTLAAIVAVASLAAFAPRPAPADDHGPGGHEAAEGIPLAARENDGPPGGRCPDGAPERAYTVVAARVDITINRYLDHDPQGRMYVLAQDLERARAEERRNAAAREGDGEPAVSLGLQGDAIQPLVIRALPGECLRVELRNMLGDEEASFHLHGASLVVSATGRPAVASEPSATAGVGGSVAYEWWVPPSEPEGTHYFHSHGDARAQTSHGLFGALIVEPPGSEWLDPRTGDPVASGWEAMIVDPAERDFREHVLFYHEIGDETYQFLDRVGGAVPLVDPLTSAYRPGARALNYRSEPFMNRLLLQQRATGRWDESLAYSSYVFGDPATPIMRAYEGDASKQRIVHGGSEVFHVHHVHGGSIRWPRQPGAEPYRAGGLEKHPPLRPVASERTDSQSIGPSETFDAENECPAGGCQASAGDFLVHCHVAHHYFAGMWGIWRVYNTLQDGRASTDALPPLLPLPDRSGEASPAVTSDVLPPRLRARVEAQLPPRGRAHGDDASVWDWARRGRRYLGEPEGRRAWPGHTPRAPGRRPPLLFDRRTGRLAYPFMRPHLGRRPPFAPGHGPSPYLDPFGSDGRVPPPPGANGDASTCPDGTTVRAFSIKAIQLPIVLNRRLAMVDPFGQIYVLAEHEAAVRAAEDLRVPLAIRANAAEDCVDVLLTNEIPSSAINHGLSKVNLHIHFVQFDVQGSDGVITGFNYEQSVRSFREEGARLLSPAAPGDTRIAVDDASRFPAGALVGVGMDEVGRFEVARVRERSGSTLILAAPLAFAHRSREWVSTEFVRYRWYPDAQVGTSYFHDHVNAVQSWRHGLFGALVVEPPGSAYRDPDTGEPLRAGPVADVVTDEPVSVDIEGAFREIVLFIQDDQPITHEGRSSGSVINLRADPLRDRGPPGSPPDPETPVLRAYVGDPIVVRALVAATNDVHTLHIDGHPFRVEPWSETSPPVGTVDIGISERFDLSIPAAGGPQAMPGDYVYRNGRSFKLREGSWGIFRVLASGSDGGPRPLPGVAGSVRDGICDAGSPERLFRVGTRASLGGEAFALLGRPERTEPLVLHVNVGDCVSFSAPDLTLHVPSAIQTHDGGGAPVLFASPEVGETVVPLRAFDPSGAGRGLYGAMVVHPRGARVLDPATGDETDAGAQVVVVPPDEPAYRDVTLFTQDEDEGIGTHKMPYTTKVRGRVAINYRAAPLDGGGVRPALADGDPATPLIEAHAGDPMRVHVLAPWSEQAQVFAVEGHRWEAEPGREGADLLDSQHIGGLDAVTLRIRAGGDAALPGDYLYGDHREPYREAGLWGILRVRERGARGLASLPGAAPASGGTGAVLGVGLVALVAGGFVALRRRRRKEGA